MALPQNSELRGGYPLWHANMQARKNYYDSIYDHLARKDDFDIIPTLFTDGGVGEKFKPNTKHDFNPDLFSSNELTVLEEVAKKFKHTSTKEIIDISHKEKGWIVNKATNGMIDYKFGFDIVL